MPLSDVLSATVSLPNCLPKQRQEHKSSQSIVIEHYELSET